MHSSRQALANGVVGSCWIEAQSTVGGLIRRRRWFDRRRGLADPKSDHHDEAFGQNKPKFIPSAGFQVGFTMVNSSGPILLSSKVWSMWRRLRYQRPLTIRWKRGTAWDLLRVPSPAGAFFISEKIGSASVDWLDQNWDSASAIYGCLDGFSWHWPVPASWLGICGCLSNYFYGVGRRAIAAPAPVDRVVGDFE